MAAVTICSDFGAQKNKVWHCFHCFPIYFPWSGGTGCQKKHKLEQRTIWNWTDPTLPSTSPEKFLDIFLLLSFFYFSILKFFITPLIFIFINYYSVQFSSVAQSCPTLCDLTNHSTPGLPVHHQLQELTQKNPILEQISYIYIL